MTNLIYLTVVNTYRHTNKLRLPVNYPAAFIKLSCCIHFFKLREYCVIFFCFFFKFQMTKFNLCNLFSILDNFS